MNNPQMAAYTEGFARRNTPLPELEREKNGGWVVKQDKPAFERKHDPKPLGDRTQGQPPASPQGLALARFFTRVDYWGRVYRGPALVHSVRNPNHWTGPRASA